VLQFSAGLIAPAGINMATLLAGSLGNSPGSNQVLAVAAVQGRVRTSNVLLDGMIVNERMNEPRKHRIPSPSIPQLYSINLNNLRFLKY
jgi:hypothetical protein